MCVQNDSLGQNCGHLPLEDALNASDSLRQCLLAWSAVWCGGRRVCSHATGSGRCVLCPPSSWADRLCAQYDSLVQKCRHLPLEDALNASDSLRQCLLAWRAVWCGGRRVCSHAGRTENAAPRSCPPRTEIAAPRSLQGLAWLDLAVNPTLNPTSSR